VIVYLYSQTAGSIRQLKLDAIETVTEERYRIADAKPWPEWTGYLEKYTVERVVGWMSPRSQHWREYKTAKRRATIILAARLILKANNETVPEKQEIGPLLSMGIFRSHARTASAQKALAYGAYRYLRKLDNRLRKQPERFDKLKAECGARP
jgi:hypothetical protein